MISTDNAVDDASVRDRGGSSVGGGFAPKQRSGGCEAEGHPASPQQHLTVVHKFTDVRQDNMLLRLRNFYSEPGHMEKIVPVINCVSNVSLRLLDWFVTNYAKKKNVMIPVQGKNGSTHLLNVYLSYRAQLKAYSKQHFDPFRRRDRINYRYTENNSIETTIGQLNFFRWVIENNILEYIEEHAHEIETDMMFSKSRQTRRSTTSKERSRSDVDRPNAIVDSSRHDGVAASDFGDKKQAAASLCDSHDKGGATATKSKTDEIKHRKTKTTSPSCYVKKSLSESQGPMGSVNHIQGTLTVRFD